MLRKMPSLALLSFKESELSSQSQTPCLIPAVSTWPGQLPTLKWKPVLSSGPAGDVTNSTYMYCDVPVGYANCLDGGPPQDTALLLTNNAEWELAQAAELSNERRVLITSIVYGQPVVGTVLITRSDRPDGAGHHILTPAIWMVTLWLLPPVFVAFMKALKG